MSASLVTRAREFAQRAHQGQVRKSGNLPYFTHLEAVAQLLQQHGVQDETSLAAAYLHDLLEDQPAFAEEFRRDYPAAVVETVECLTEIKRNDDGSLRPKSQRFDEYVKSVQRGSEAALRARPISCADKVHNISNIAEAEKSGDSLMMRLRTRPGQQRAQLSTLRKVYAGSVPETLLQAFDAATQTLMDTIDAWLPGRAVHLAAEAHLGQFDRAGKPYIYHPMHLAMQTQDRDERMLAMLHDVVEDTAWDLQALADEGFPEHLLAALDCLTRRERESYEQFIDRIAKNPLASRVKLLDLKHNSDLSRLPSVSDKDRERATKYQQAIARLERSTKA